MQPRGTSYRQVYRTIILQNKHDVANRLLVPYPASACHIPRRGAQAHARVRAAGPHSRRPQHGIRQDSCGVGRSPSMAGRRMGVESPGAAEKRRSEFASTSERLVMQYTKLSKKKCSQYETRERKAAKFAAMIAGLRRIRMMREAGRAKENNGSGNEEGDSGSSRGGRCWGWIRGA